MQRCCSSVIPISRVLWAAPCSLLGAFLGGFALIAGARIQLIDGALEFFFEEGSGAEQWLTRHQPFAAITLGHVILGINEAELRAWHAHERVHVSQFERWGALMLLAYPAASLWAWLRGRDAYLANYFEQQAYRADAGTVL
jgi:hypothetical protein